MSNRLASLLGVGSIILAAATALGFTQKSPITSVGHEYLIVQAAHAAGGAMREPTANEVTGPQASCRFCDKYDTNGWKIWSALMGNRWIDIGGYNIIAEKARAKVNGWKTDCFDAAIQDSEAVQYQHALRRKCDAGKDGLFRTHNGTVATMRDRFMRALQSGEPATWFRDGGAWMLRFKADRAYFLLGMSLHALQDSFSEEHVVRSSDWLKIRNYKTYVGRSPLLLHAHADTDPEKYVFDGHLWPQPNTKNGDYVFSTMTSNAASNLKTSAEKAVEASADLIKAYEAARLAPKDVTKFWNDFERKWLTLDPSPDALTNDGPPSDCKVDSDNRESLRMTCLNESGIEQALSSPLPPMSTNVLAALAARGSMTKGPVTVGTAERVVESPRLANASPVTKAEPNSLISASITDQYPKFCWPESECHDDLAQIAADATKKAVIAAGKVLSNIAQEFANLAQDVEDFFDHAPHSYQRCYDESGDFGMRAGDKYMNRAEKKADTFFLEIGDAFNMLTLPERKAAIDGNWNSVKKGLLDQGATTRDKACDRVRNWFFKNSSKQDGENHCREDFNEHVTSLAEDLQSIYDLHMNKALPESQTHANGDPGAPLGHDLFKARRTLESRYRAQNTLCKQSAVAFKTTMARRPAGLPAVIDSSPVRLSRCDTALTAKLAFIGKAQLPQAVVENESAKRERLYLEMQACIRDPIDRFHNLLRQEDICIELHDKALKSAGLTLRPVDDMKGKPPIQK
jgi:hypothetical protein